MEKIRILYIEDDFKQRQELASRLRTEKFSVTAAATGPAGLVWFEKRAFDVVLCDLNMPEMDGLGVLKHIREKDRDVPFIILSSHGTVPLALKAVKNGASYFLLKPVEVHQLALTINLALERTRLERTLEDSQAALQMVARNVPDIIYSLNMQGEFISISPSAKSALGYNPSEFIGKSVFEIIHPDDREWVKQSFIRSVQTGGPKVKTLQFRMVAKTGKVKHFEINRTLIKKEGRIIRNDGIARDVTRRVLLEQKLQDYSQELIDANMKMLDVQEKLEKKNTELEKVLKELSKGKEELQIIIDSNPGAIVLVDQNGFIKSSNKKACAFLGISQKKIIGLSFDELILEVKGRFKDSHKFVKLVEQLKKKPDIQGELDIHEVFERGCRLLGDRFLFLAPFCFRVADRQKRAIGHLWVFSDITSLKQADSQVHTIVNSCPIPTIISRLADGRVLYANEELAHLIGLTAKELVGRNTPDFYYDLEDRQKVIEGLNKDGYLRNFETRIKNVDGSIIWMIFSLVITEVGGEKVILGWLYDISERKKIEEALDKERNFVSAILDTAGALVVVLDVKGRIVRFNRACEQTTGYTAAEVLGKSLWDVFLIPEEVDFVKGVFKELRSGQFPNQAENYWLAKDGSQRLIAWCNSALLDEKGSVEFIIGTGIDITEHRRMEAELQQSEQKYRELVENANSIILRWDKAGNITFFNEYAQEFFGYKEHEIIGKSVMGTIVPDEDRTGKDLKAMIMDIARRPDAYISNENENIKRSGERVWISWTNKPIFDENGKLQEILSVGKDETERQKAREAIVARLKYEEGLAACSQTLLSDDTQRDVLSDALQHLLKASGTSRVYIFENFEDPKDGLCLRLTHEVCAPGVSSNLDDPLLQHGPYKMGFERWRRILSQDKPIMGLIESFPKSERIILEPQGILSILVLPLWVEGKWYGFIGFDDVESRREWKEADILLLQTAADMIDNYIEIKTVMEDLAKSNKELKETQAQLVQSEKMASLGSLVAGIAHEINTPIGAVNSMHDTLFRTIDILRENIASRHPQELEQLSSLKTAFKVFDDSHKVIRSGTERVINIVRRLKSFARLDEAELKTVDVHEGLEDTLVLIHHEIKHNIDVVKKYGDVPPIACFPGQLNQVFLNLFINSKHAIKDKGTISISTSHKDNKVLIKIKDTGSGIPKENLKKIFDPGFTTKGRGVGAGLGLSICYQIIQAHRGEIKVQSELGKGTTFTIILPMNLEHILENEKKRS